MNAEAEVTQKTFRWCPWDAWWDYLSQATWFWRTLTNGSDMIDISVVLRGMHDGITHHWRRDGELSPPPPPLPSPPNTETDSPSKVTVVIPGGAVSVALGRAATIDQMLAPAVAVGAREFPAVRVVGVAGEPALQSVIQRAAIDAHFQPVAVGAKFNK